MTRSVDDAALLLDVLSRPDARDWSALAPPDGWYTDGLDGGITRLKVAFSPALGHVDVDPHVAGLVRSAVDVLANPGAEVEQMDPGLREVSEEGRKLSALDYLEAVAQRMALEGLMGRFHERFDLLVTPTLPLTAFETGHEVPPGSVGPRWTSWTPSRTPPRPAHEITQPSRTSQPTIS